MAAQQWSQLFWRMERCAIATLSARVRAYEVEIRKRYEQRALPGWNFCTYFCLRESVAFVYAQVRDMRHATCDMRRVVAPLVARVRAP
jgi:hypothetical protein